MNVGIGDVDNLAWKLAAVVTGRSTGPLLDTYEAERRPIARQVIDRSLENLRRRYSIDDTLLLSARYRSAAVAAPPGESTLDLDGYRPSGLPGHRAPHLALDDGRSTVDLSDFTVRPEIPRSGRPKPSRPASRSSTRPMGTPGVSSTRSRPTARC